MSGKIDPEAARRSGTQSFELSDRNPVVNHFGEEGGQLDAPPEGASRMTPEGPAVPAGAGLKY